MKYKEVLRDCWSRLTQSEELVRRPGCVTQEHLLKLGPGEQSETLCNTPQFCCLLLENTVQTFHQPLLPPNKVILHTSLPLLAVKLYTRHLAD